MRRSLRTLLALNIERARSWGIDPVLIAVPPRVYQSLSAELVELGPKEFIPDEPPCMFLLHDGVAVTKSLTVTDSSEFPMRIKLLVHEVPRVVPAEPSD